MNQNKSRGLFLTIMLVLGTLGVLSSFFTQISNNTHGNTYLAITGLDLVVFAVAAYGIWTWKKWGAYLIALYLFIALSELFVVNTSSAVGILVVFIIVAGIWYWAIKRKWANFK